MAVSTDSRKTGVNAGMSLLAASSTAVSLTGTLTKTALATVTIPAGAMGATGGLLVYSTFSLTSSANAKTLRVSFGGLNGTDYLSSAPTTSASLGDVRRIRNRTASTQVGGAATTSNPFALSGGSVVTSSVDTSVATTLVISGELANVADTITLENYEVWLLPG